jgi:hypothetical protein
MFRPKTSILLPVFLLIACIAESADTFNTDPDAVRMVTEDLGRFWAAWDEAVQDPARRREIFLEQYLEAGTAGLHKFLELRIGDVDQLLAAIDAHPGYYESLRELTPRASAAAEPVLAGLHDLQRLFPEAVFPDTYVVIGRMNSGGTIDLAGLLIGFEMYGLTPDTPVGELGEWHRRVIGPVDRLPLIIMHELIHFQQAVHGRLDFTTLLGQSLAEGAADFITELVLGSHPHRHVHEWALSREAELWAEFREKMHGEELSGWLYDGAGIEGRPADLGYFIGYRIAQAYLEQVGDKQAAVHDIITMTDPEAFLEVSGYAERLTRADPAHPSISRSLVRLRDRAKDTGHQ